MIFASSIGATLKVLTDLKHGPCFFFISLCSVSAYQAINAFMCDPIHWFGGVPVRQSTIGCVFE